MTEETITTTERVKTPEQNNVKRPQPGTMIAKLWQIADIISEEKQRPATRKEVVDEYMEKIPSAVSATANTQYARWVTFHGFGDRLRADRKLITIQRRSEKEKEREQVRIAKNTDKGALKTLKDEARAKTKAEREAKGKEKEEVKARKAQERLEKQNEKEAAKQIKRDTKLLAVAVKHLNPASVD